MIQKDLLTPIFLTSAPGGLVSMVRQKATEPRKERWAFSQSEIVDPVKCNGHDELVAYVDIDDDWGGIEGYGIIVYRNGKVSNRFDDGTTGVPKILVELADSEENLLHSDGEETSEWKNVMADDKGNFLCFAR
jgi:hypothetical protein